MLPRSGSKGKGKRANTLISFWESLSPQKQDQDEERKRPSLKERGSRREPRTQSIRQKLTVFQQQQATGTTTTASDEQGTPNVSLSVPAAGTTTVPARGVSPKRKRPAPMLSWWQKEKQEQQQQQELRTTSDTKAKQQMSAQVVRERARGDKYTGHVRTKREQATETPSQGRKREQAEDMPSLETTREQAKQAEYIPLLDTTREQAKDTPGLESDATSRGQARAGEKSEDKVTRVKEQDKVTRVKEQDSAKRKDQAVPREPHTRTDLTRDSADRQSGEGRVRFAAREAAADQSRERTEAHVSAAEEAEEADEHLVQAETHLSHKDTAESLGAEDEAVDAELSVMAAETQGEPGSSTSPKDPRHSPDLALVPANNLTVAVEAEKAVYSSLLYESDFSPATLAEPGRRVSLTKEEDLERAALLLGLTAEQVSLSEAAHADIAELEQLEALEATLGLGFQDAAIAQKEGDGETSQDAAQEGYSNLPTLDMSFADTQSASLDELQKEEMHMAQELLNIERMEMAAMEALLAAEEAELEQLMTEMQYLLDSVRFFWLQMGRLEDILRHFKGPICSMIWTTQHPRGHVLYNISHDPDLAGYDVDPSGTVAV
eukprot:g5034.t1